jgi:hypothetical protein
MLLKKSPQRNCGIRAVSSFCESRGIPYERDQVQTIVTHRRHSSSCVKPGFPRTPELASRLALFRLAWKTGSLTVVASFSISVESSSLALRFASEAAPNSRQDPRAIIGQFTDQSGLYYLNARSYDAGIRHTDQSARAWERSDMICSWPCGARRSMDWDEYFRQQAAMYRKLAEKTEDAFIKQELLDLAAVCEEVANNIEDHQTSG